MSEHIICLRATKLEVLMGRTLTKDALTKPRREKLYGEFKASFVKDISTWGIEGADWKLVVWKVLQDLCEASVK
jgi:hypothetical protein